MGDIGVVKRRFVQPEPIKVQPFIMPAVPMPELVPVRRQPVGVPAKP